MKLSETISLGFVVLLLLAGIVVVPMYGCPKYKVWQQGQEGQAELSRAQQNRQIAVQEAQAKKEAAVELAQAEVERAKGVAKANEIIGNSLKGNESYLHYLQIHALEATAQAGDKVIYVPTEANLPILESGRLRRDKAEDAQK